MKFLSIKTAFVAALTLCLSTTSISAWSQATYPSSGFNNRPQKARPAPAKKGFDKDKLIYGGGLYGGGGNRIISLGFSPIAGYRITDFWSAGISLGYKYFYQRDFFSVFNVRRSDFDYFNLNNHIFVPGVWTRLGPFWNFFTHFEFENVISTYKNYEMGVGNTINSFRTTESVPCLLLGGGIRQPMSERSSFVFYALYDVFQNLPSNQRTAGNGMVYSRSPYAGTLDIRVGLNIGF